MNEVHDFKFYNLEKTLADKPFLKQPFGDVWETYTWAETGKMARRLANGLLSLGLAPKSHIGLVSKNCREWVIADLAIMMAGYVSVPLYPTLTGEQIKEVLEIGDVVALFAGKLDSWEDMKTGVPESIPIIAFPHYKGHSEVKEGKQWHEFINAHEPIEGEPRPMNDDIWTIIFTSGTTGTPKGVVMKFGALQSTDIITNELNPLKIDMGGENRFFSFLPLNHIAERIAVESNCLSFGGELSFAESLETFAKNLGDAKPTFFFAVPRIWTKFQLGILSKMPQKKLNLFLKIPILNNVIRKKLKTAMGLNEARVCLSGAAPITASQKEWYKSIGVNIAEAYGMSENCGITSYLPGEVYKPGSVGKAQVGCKVKIDEETGEILMQAAYMMTGYYKNPEKTAEVMVDGWLKTGDQGRLDKEGYLYITGRISDTFKTSKGQFIVPAPMEWAFDKNHDIDQICIVGRGCPQPVALLVPSDIGLAKSQEDLKKSIEASLHEVNNEAKSYSKISTLIVVNSVWDVENGMLTPTLKAKRNVIGQHYEQKLMAWHEAEDAVIWE